MQRTTTQRNRTPINPRSSRSFLLFSAAIFAFATRCSPIPDPSPSGVDTSPDTAAPRPNIILISLDTTRADYLGCYGHPWVETPELDALAASGILFEHTYSPAPVTLCAHTSIMTGVHSHTHGVPGNGFWVNGENETLAECLDAAGYHTSGFISAPPLGSQYNFPQGFDHFDEHFVETSTETRDVILVKERSAASTTTAVLNYVDGIDNEQPQFLFVHYFDPHFPYLPPPEYLERYENLPDSPPPVAFDEFVRKRLESLTHSQTSEHLSRLLYHYAAEISYTDHWVGELVAGLRDRGILDNSILIVTSDHGETLWDAEPLFQHGFTAHASEMRAVGIVRLPNAQYAGTRIETPVSTIDWMPSILSYLNLAIPDRVEGRDLAFSTGAANLEPENIYGEAVFPFVLNESDTWPNADKARYILSFPWRLTLDGNGMEWELYDLREDDASPTPAESIPAAMDATLETLREELDAWTNDAQPLPSEDITRLDQASREELNALGYR